MPSPQTLDFTALADGVVRNNVGVDGITVAVQAECEGDFVVVTATGQRLPARRTVATTGEQPWLWFTVEGHGPGETVAVRCIGTSRSPAELPTAAPR